MPTTAPGNPAQFSATRLANYTTDTNASTALTNLISSLCAASGRLSRLEAYEVWRSMLTQGSITTVTDANSSTAVSSAAFTGS